MTSGSRRPRLLASAAGLLLIIGAVGCGGSSGTGSTSAGAGLAGPSATQASTAAGPPKDDPAAVVGGPAFHRFVVYALEKDGVKSRAAETVASCIVRRLERQGIHTARQAERGPASSAPLTNATTACASSF